MLKTNYYNLCCFYSVSWSFHRDDKAEEFFFFFCTLSGICL